MKKGMEWAVGSVSKHGTELSNFLEIFGLSVNAQKLIWADVLEFMH